MGKGGIGSGTAVRSVRRLDWEMWSGGGRSRFQFEKCSAPTLHPRHVRVCPRRCRLDLRANHTGCPTADAPAPRATFTPGTTSNADVCSITAGGAWTRAVARRLGPGRYHPHGAVYCRHPVARLPRRPERWPTRWLPSPMRRSRGVRKEVNKVKIIWLKEGAS